MERGAPGALRQRRKVFTSASVCHRLALCFESDLHTLIWGFCGPFSRWLRCHVLLCFSFYWWHYILTCRKKWGNLLATGTSPCCMVKLRKVAATALLYLTPVWGVHRWSLNGSVCCSKDASSSTSASTHSFLFEMLKKISSSTGVSNSFSTRTTWALWWLSKV